MNHYYCVSKSRAHEHRSYYVAFFAYIFQLDSVPVVWCQTFYGPLAVMWETHWLCLGMTLRDNSTSLFRSLRLLQCSSGDSHPVVHTPSQDNDHSSRSWGPREFHFYDMVGFAKSEVSIGGRVRYPSHAS
jgi:hypothetical protein